MTQSAADAAAATTTRRQWMATLARASASEMDELLTAAPPLPAYQLLRGPESGMIMLRGRAGASGAAFNFGEATVARCSIRSAPGFLGHSWRLGRDHRAAELAAVLDAALQDSECAPALQSIVLAPLAAAQQARRDRIGRQAAATSVQFFTLATMRT